MKKNFLSPRLFVYINKYIDSYLILLLIVS